MRVFISETDKQNARRVALANIAKFYGVPDWQYDDNDKLLIKINRLNTLLYAPLQEYFKAYDVKCHILDKVRVIYGMKDIEAFSDYAHADTLYSSDGHYIIPKINCDKTPNLIGQVQCYEKTTLPNGEPGTNTVDAYFLLNPNIN